MATKGLIYEKFDIDLANLRVIFTNIEYLRKIKKTKNYQPLWSHYHKVGDYQSAVYALDQGLISPFNYYLWDYVEDLIKEINLALNKISPLEDKTLQVQIHQLQTIRDFWISQSQFLVVKKTV